MQFEPIDQFQQRRKKKNSAEIESLGYTPLYPHGMPPRILQDKLSSNLGNVRRSSCPLIQSMCEWRGRIVALRPHGKAAFAHLQGDGERLQIYVKLDMVGEQDLQTVPIARSGRFCRCCRASVSHQDRRAHRLGAGAELLSKSLLPLPEKWHGLADVEIRYRQRYLDLIANERAREIFVRRAQIRARIAAVFRRAGISKSKRR